MMVNIWKILEYPVVCDYNIFMPGSLYTSVVRSYHQFLILYCIISPMDQYRFFHPVEVRYGDLDPQGHVNNAKYVTYFETARIHYKIHLGTFQPGQSFLDIGVILADLQITFLAPILLGAPIKVGVRTSKLGNKSIQMEQCIVSEDEQTVFATGKVVLVAFDYRHAKSVPIPEDWRIKMIDFEGLA